MSQSGLLNEEDIRDCLEELLNIKIDIKALLNPTQDVVVAIYSKFLDFFCPGWRQPAGLQQDRFSIKRLIVCAIAQIASKIEQTHEFTMNDILKPNKRRTTIFLNVLIFSKVQIDEKLANFNAEDERRKASKDEFQRLTQESANLRAVLEQKAIENSYLPSTAEIQQQRDAAEAYFETLRPELSLENDLNERKASIESLKLQVEQARAIPDRLSKEKEENAAILQTLDDNRETRNLIVTAESRLRRQEELMENQGKEPPSEQLVRELASLGVETDEIEQKLAARKAIKFELADFEGSNLKLHAEWQLEEAQAQPELTKKNEARKTIKNDHREMVEQLKSKIKHLEDDIVKHQEQARKSADDFERVKNKIRNDLASLEGKKEAIFKSSASYAAAIMSHQSKIERLFKLPNIIANQTYDVNILGR